jgi:two-component system sensor histidine kinase DegS
VDPTQRFTPRQGELLATFASQAGAAFEKARLYQLALDQLEELRKARTKLAKESKELEQALAAMVRVQEEERARIAADVHDGVVQMMVGSLCELQAAMAHFPHEPDMVQAKQHKSRALIRDSITELRRVILDLRPITLDAAGLVPAVENLVEDMKSMFDSELELRVSGTPCRFSSEVEIGAYRIIQEAVNNALKHAQAVSVTISTQFANGTLGITVSDDGQGFSVEDATSIYGPHAGLIGMRERARSLGGELSIASVVNRGTTVSAEIPCRPRTRGRQSAGLAQ